VIEAAFQREGENVFLEMKLTNKTGNEIGEFAIKFNKNQFKLTAVN